VARVVELLADLEAAFGVGLALPGAQDVDQRRRVDLRLGRLLPQ
jgi:hypothetical protein